jgi:uncharacterized protein
VRVLGSARALACTVRRLAERMDPHEKHSIAAAADFVNPGLRRGRRKEHARRPFDYRLWQAVRPPEFSAAVWLAILWFAAGLKASAAEVIPPKPDRYFNDYAGVVSKDAALRFNEQLAQFERESSAQVVVAIYPKMQTDSSIDDYTRRIAKIWDIGQRTTQNGAALFVFIEDRKMFIQTAHGVEGALPDATAFDITERHIKPEFRAGNYEKGLAIGIDLICKAIRGEYTGTGETATERKEQGNAGGFILFFFIFVIVLIVMARASRRYGGYGYSSGGGPIFFPMGGGGGSWSSGGGGGGFSGFTGGGGGGGFGGGGAGSSW